MEQYNEVWKDYNNSEGRYQLSNFGRVKSLRRIIYRKDGRIHYTQKELILNKSYNK